MSGGPADGVLHQERTILLEVGLLRDWTGAAPPSAPDKCSPTPLGVVLCARKSATSFDPANS